MKFNWIEIGTSDFESLVQGNDNDVGISVEPMGFYLDNLPNKSNVIKLNCAISNRDGQANIFWVHPNDIEKYDLPWWLRGASSIDIPHLGLVREIKQRNLDFLLRMNLCQIISWKTLIRKFKITELDFLKVDTEGHDCIIINNLLDSEEKLLPKKINFEIVNVIDKESVRKTIDRLVLTGYKVIENNDWDVTVEL